VTQKRFKIQFRKECGFDSHRPHQLFETVMINGANSPAGNPFLEFVRLDIVMRAEELRFVLPEMAARIEHLTNGVSANLTERVFGEVHF
jgi:hypothetical protein